jgi:hypothetical protein
MVIHSIIKNELSCFQMTAIPMQSRRKEVWVALNPLPMSFRLSAQTKYDETRGFEDDIK